MIGLFSVFEAMESQGNYMEEFMARVSTNSHGCLLLLFLLCISILYISSMYILLLSWNTFWNYWELSFVTTCVG